MHHQLLKTLLLSFVKCKIYTISAFSDMLEFYKNILLTYNFGCAIIIT